MESRLQFRLSSGLFQLAWIRYKDDWKIEWQHPSCFKDESIRLPHLVPERLGASDTAEAYYPFEILGQLVSRFADMETGEDAVSFAGDFGPLGFTSEPGAAGTKEEAWEYVGHVLAEAADLRFARTLLRHINQNDRSNLKQFVEWRSGKVWVQPPGSNWSPLEMFYPPTQEERQLLRDGELRRPARVFLGLWVTRHLRGGLSFELITDKLGKTRPILKPVSLRVALWVGVALEIAGNLRFRSCEICGREMDVTEKRSHKRVHDSCSKRERMKSWRKSRLKEGGKRG